MKLEHRLFSWICAAFLIGLSQPALAEPTFQGIGDLPGSGYFSIARAVSADGAIVVGQSQAAAGTEAFRWTIATGMLSIGDLPGGLHYSYATGISDDGTTIVGHSSGSSAAGGAFRWTSAGGMVELTRVAGSSGTGASGVSADGSTVVGHASYPLYSRALMWPDGGGLVELGYLPAHTDTSRAEDVSADGSTAVGYSFAWGFTWTSGGGMVSIGGIPGGTGGSDARAISADGSTIVGSGGTLDMYGFEETYAIRRTSAEGVVPLGSIPGGDYESEANAVSADSSTIVGLVHAPGGPQAFVWDAANGMRLLSVVLTDLGLDLTGWKLRDAYGVSADGRVIVGKGINPNGDTEGWVADLGDAQQVPALGPVALAILAGLLGAVGVRRWPLEHPRTRGAIGR
jgi:probable HAF family extracellular repeat protein